MIVRHLRLTLEQLDEDGRVIATMSVPHLVVDTGHPLHKAEVDWNWTEPDRRTFLDEMNKPTLPSLFHLALRGRGVPQAVGGAYGSLVVHKAPKEKS